VIFPAHCKFVGHATSMPAGERVYFLSRYLVHETGEGPEVLEVTTDPDSGTVMRTVTHTRVLATPGEVAIYPDRVNLHHRTDLIRRAQETGKRCTIFTGLDEHMTFVLDPDSSILTALHIYDSMPPRPHLSETIRSLEETGIFGELQVTFHHHVRDLRKIGADMYPCRAAGFPRTLDEDPLIGGEIVAGCLTGELIAGACYGGRNVTFVDICPANGPHQQPYIARCCRRERGGLVRTEDSTGYVVHWGSSPKEISDAVFTLVDAWRGRI
jgi:hypothetical protein